MTNWFITNFGTILVSAILVGVVALILVSLKNKKKQGISTCGCNCSCCPMGSCCHQK